MKPSPRRKRPKGGKNRELEPARWTPFLIFLFYFSSPSRVILSLSFSLALCVCSASLDESPALTFNSIFVGYHCSVSNFNPHISHPHSSTPISIQLRLCSEFFLSFLRLLIFPFLGFHSLKVKLTIKFIFTRINTSHIVVSVETIYTLSMHMVKVAPAERKRPKEFFLCCLSPNVSISVLLIFISSAFHSAERRVSV